MECVSVFFESEVLARFHFCFSRWSEMEAAFPKKPRKEMSTKSMKGKQLSEFVIDVLLFLVLALLLALGGILTFAEQTPTMGMKFYPPEAEVDREVFQKAYEKALNFLPKDKLRDGGLLRVHVGEGGPPAGEKISHGNRIAEVWLATGSTAEFIRALALLVSVRMTHERKIEIGRKIAKAIGEGDPYAAGHWIQAKPEPGRAPGN